MAECKRVSAAQDLCNRDVAALSESMRRMKDDVLAACTSMVRDVVHTRLSPRTISSSSASSSSGASTTSSPAVASTDPFRVIITPAPITMPAVGVATAADPSPRNPTQESTTASSSNANGANSARGGGGSVGNGGVTQAISAPSGNRVGVVSISATATGVTATGVTSSVPTSAIGRSHSTDVTAALAPAAAASDVEDAMAASSGATISPPGAPSAAGAAATAPTLPTMHASARSPPSSAPAVAPASHSSLADSREGGVDTPTPAHSPPYVKSAPPLVETHAHAYDHSAAAVSADAAGPSSQQRNGNGDDDGGDRDDADHAYDVYHLFVALSELHRHPRGQNNPIVALFVPSPHASATIDPLADEVDASSFQYSSQTEWLVGSREPEFQRPLEWHHTPSQRLIKLNVYDVDNEDVSDDDRIGTVLIRCSDLVERAGTGKVTFQLCHEDPLLNARAQQVEIDIVCEHVRGSVGNVVEETSVAEVGVVAGASVVTAAATTAAIATTGAPASSTVALPAHVASEAIAKPPTASNVSMQVAPTSSSTSTVVSSSLPSPSSALPATTTATTLTTHALSGSSPRQRSPRAPQLALDLIISCRSLPISKTSGRCDPIVAVFAQNADDAKFTYVAQTEWMKDMTDPDFAQSLLLPLPHGLDTEAVLKFSVYDVDREVVTDRDRVGSVLVRLTDLVHPLRDLRSADESKEFVFELLHEHAGKLNALKRAQSLILIAPEIVEEVEEELNRADDGVDGEEGEEEGDVEDEEEEEEEEEIDEVEDGEFESRGAGRVAAPAAQAAEEHVIEHELDTSHSHVYDAYTRERVPPLRFVPSLVGENVYVERVSSRSDGAVSSSSRGPSSHRSMS